MSESPTPSSDYSSDSDSIMGWKAELREAKRLHRPSLKNWEADGLYETFPSFVRSLLSDHSRQYEYFIPCDENAPLEIPAVLDARELTKLEFWNNYEAKEIPCVIKGIPDGYDSTEKTKEWPAIANWELEALEQDEYLRNRKFKCGEDDDGNKIKVKLAHFLLYLRHNRDDSPVYVFDSNFDEDKRAKKILKEFTVPSYFSNDLFRFISESRRPPYRWFLVGPERSGTCVHIDPLATNAWNTLIHGKKRWVLFPPHVPKHIVKGKGLIRDDEDDEAIHYFMFILPRIKRKAESQQHRDEYRGFACYEFTQHERETVFIPSGWWHAVLNLTDTVGITQNYCSPRNFDKVWLETRTGRKRMAWKWLGQLDEHFPHLAERARSMNKRDNFRMKYDPAEIKRREQIKEQIRELEQGYHSSGRQQKQQRTV